MEKIIVNTNPFGFGEDNEYHYNAQVWTYTMGKWWYAGKGKYCKTLEDVLKYASELNLSVEFNWQYHSLLCFWLYLKKF